MKTLKNYPLLVLFAVFLLVTSVADMFISRRKFSEMENRYLEQRPAFSFEQLLKNEYTPKYETYVNDQFVGRDGWITMKSISESALGKIENNGIVYGGEDHLFENYTTLDERRFAMNRDFLNQFIEAYGDQTQITISVIPNSYTVLNDLLPRGLHNVDQQQRIEEIYAGAGAGARSLDLLPVMRDAAVGARAGQGGSYPGDPTYYRTDHHWTTWGAYSAYQAFVKSRGLQEVNWEQLDPLKRLEQDFLGSYYSKCKLFSAVPDVIAWYEIPFTEMTVGGEEKESLHDVTKWDTRDKHAAFLWGNNDLTVLRSDNNLNHIQGKTSRILLIKDSYGNSFAPFLTYSYDEVYVVDLRSLSGKMSELMANTTFDDVLVMYNFMNFASDTNLAFLTY